MKTKTGEFIMENEKEIKDFLNQIAKEFEISEIPLVELPIEIRGDIHDLFRKLSDLTPIRENHDQIIDAIMSAKSKLLSNDRVSLMLINRVSIFINDICINISNNREPTDFDKLIILLNEYSQKYEATEIDFATTLKNNIMLAKKLNEIIAKWNEIAKSIIDLINYNLEGCENPDCSFCNQNI